MSGARGVRAPPRLLARPPGAFPRPPSRLSHAAPAPPTAHRTTPHTPPPQEWYDIKAPSMFTHRVSGKTPVTRTSGTHVASESLKGRVFTVSLADLAGSEDLDYRKIKAGTLMYTLVFIDRNNPERVTSTASQDKWGNTQVGFPAWGRHESKPGAGYISEISRFSFR